jgi:hypothetical protein
MPRMLPPHRIDLIEYKGALLTEDTIAALEEAQKQADANGWSQANGWFLDLVGPRGVENPRLLDSLVPAGREVRVWMRKEGVSAKDSLTILWNLLLPLGFLPMQRFPEIHEPDLGTQWVFYFLGPWNDLYQRLLADDSVTYIDAWASVCAAAQIDVGMWRGDKMGERIIQTLLTFIGADLGPVDGVIGPRTLAALDSHGVPEHKVHRIHGGVIEEVRALAPLAPPAETKKTTKKKKK